MSARRPSAAAHERPRFLSTEPIAFRRSDFLARRSCGTQLRETLPGASFLRVGLGDGSKHGGNKHRECPPYGDRGVLTAGGSCERFLRGSTQQASQTVRFFEGIGPRDVAWTLIAGCAHVVDHRTAVAEHVFLKVGAGKRRKVAANDSGVFVKYGGVHGAYEHARDRGLGRGISRQEQRYLRVGKPVGVAAIGAQFADAAPGQRESARAEQRGRPRCQLRRCHSQAGRDIPGRLGEPQGRLRY